MKLLNKITFIFIIISAASSHCISLNEALTSTYNSNDEFKQKQVEFVDSLENFSRALSGFLPDISATLQQEDKKQTTRSQFVNNQSSNSKRLSRGISIQQNLFNGGSSVANLKAAQSGFRAARAKFYDSEQQIMYSAILAYLNYEEAKNVDSVNDASVNFYAKSFESVEAKFKVGEATRTQLALAESQLAIAKSNRSQSTAKLEEEKAKFKQIIGLDPISIEKSTLPEIPTNLEEFSVKALNRNFALDSVKHSLAASKSSIAAAAGNLLPTLTASISTVRAYPHNESRQNPNIQEFTTSLTLNIPILSKGGAEYSNVRHARNASRSAALNIDKVIKSIEMEIASSWEQFQALKLGTESSALAIQAKTMALDGVNQEFNVGLKDIVDVLNVEKDLTDAKIQQARINKDYLLQAYKMKLLTSDLTAKKMNLKVKYFNPEDEFKKIKMKIVGF
jgi:outer membrane protein